VTHSTRSRDLSLVRARGKYEKCISLVYYRAGETFLREVPAWQS